MQRISVFVAVAALLTLNGCVSFKQIGTLTMLSTRNVDAKTDYVNIRSYMGASKKELKKSRAETLEDAVNATVKNTPGGEFLKNAKVYIVGHGKKTFYYAVEGDVWGISENANFRGWKVGDRVQWKVAGKPVTGIITDLKSQKLCSIKQDGSDVVQDISYDKLSKAE